MTGFLLGVVCGWVSLIAMYCYLQARSFRRDFKKIKECLEWVVIKVKYCPILGKTRHFEWDTSHPNKQ